MAINQLYVMSNSPDAATWKQIVCLKSQIERSFIEKEIHWTQRTKQSWFLLEDRNNKFFQTMTTIRKRKYYMENQR